METNYPHLVPLDLMLPGTDGIELMGDILDMPTCRSTSCRPTAGRKSSPGPSRREPTTTWSSPSRRTELVARVKAALRKREAP